MHIGESAEMYLETILLLSQKETPVRAIDVARHTGYSKPSVSRAMGLLRQSGDLSVTQEGFLCLTEQGKTRAEGVLERHRVLCSFLEQLGVDPATADADACKIEHVISDATLQAIKHFSHPDSC